MADAPPRPPPHGAKTSNLPDGNYDIFIIPPHSAGSGFLYLPSLKPNLNSFIAGFCSALLAVGIYNILVPAISQTFASLNSGIGVLLALAAVGVAFSFGRTTGENNSGTDPGSGPGSAGANTPNSRPNFGFPDPSSQGQRSPPQPQPASSSWEKAREETRRREQERKKAEEAKAATDAAAKRKEEAEKAARAAAEKERWEQARAREKDVREREARERIARERAAKTAGAGPGGPRKYEKPTAQSATDSDYFTHYQRPYGSSVGSVSEQSESSYAHSAGTARTTPPPSMAGKRGPYVTSDPNKVVVCGVYLFVGNAPKAASNLVRGQAGVTDGLILRITTEGLFIDDDVRGVPQREWDVKAWSIKLVETGRLDDMHVFRATIRDAETKKYIFVLPAEQSWKVDVGLERLRKGSQVRSLGMNGIKAPEMKNILMELGWK